MFGANRHRYAAACILLLVGVGCAESNEFVAPPPPTVTVQSPQQREVITNIPFVGRTVASATVEIRARVKGFLQSVEFEPSQRVTVGQTLFTIEPETYEANLASANADLESRKAAAELARTSLARMQQAFDKNAVAELELDKAKAEQDTALAAIKAAKAAVDAAELDLSYCTIESPLVGRVSRQLVDVGNLVGAGESTLLTTIVLADPIYAYFNIDERTLLPFLGRRPAEESPRDRARVTMQLSDGRTYEHTGVIDFAENVVDAKTGTIQVRAVFPNPDGFLYPGLFVRILLPNDPIEALLVPELAIQRDIVGPYVLVVDDQGLVKRTNVVVGPLHEGMRVIESGVDASSRIVVNGVQRARDGITVKAVMADDAEQGPTPPDPSPSNS